MTHVAVHPTWGIFIGCALGLAFWSKLEAGSQTHAPTFSGEEDQREAREFFGTFVHADELAKLTFVGVTAGADGYASMDACALAGLERWEP